VVLENYMIKLVEKVPPITTPGYTCDDSNSPLEVAGIQSFLACNSVKRGAYPAANRLRALLNIVTKSID
jgi:hypothetical protein